MPQLPLVPAPLTVNLDDAKPAFRLHAGTGLRGPSNACATLSAIVRTRTGLALSETASEEILFRLDDGGAPGSYRIVVEEGSVEASAPDAAGLFYAAQTLGQALMRDGQRWAIPALTVEDRPRFAYRGVMLDVARHFHSVDVVKAFIDRASSLKFNALHLHLNDDQGWRLALSSRPGLTELGSSTSGGGDPGGFYTQADYADIIEYAAAHQMLVVPELDMPGHTHVVGLAYPELAEDPVISHEVQQTVEAFGGGIPTRGAPYTGMAVGFSSLRTRDEATYDFVSDVFTELAALTPGPYLHFGGDESLATSDADFAQFVSRVSKLIVSLRKIPIAWHEAGSSSIAETTIGQYWGFTTRTDDIDEKARAFVANGSQLILSPADATYLDMKYDGGTPLGLTWANGPTSVERAYSWEPDAIIKGVGEEQILGVEAPLWTETVRTLEDIDTLSFPRIAAVAESAWSSKESHDWGSFRSRVGGLGPLWQAQGIAFYRSPEIDWVVE